METENHLQGEPRSPETEREAWSYRAFVEAYNAFNGLEFVEGEFMNEQILREKYEKGEWKTVAEFAAHRFDYEQGESADTVPARFMQGREPVRFD